MYMVDFLTINEIPAVKQLHVRLSRIMLLIIKNQGFLTTLKITAAALTKSSLYSHIQGCAPRSRMSLWI